MSDQENAVQSDQAPQGEFQSWLWQVNARIWPVPMWEYFIIAGLFLTRIWAYFAQEMAWTNREWYEQNSLLVFWVTIISHNAIVAWIVWFGGRFWHFKIKGQTNKFRE